MTVEQKHKTTALEIADLANNLSKALYGLGSSTDEAIKSINKFNGVAQVENPTYTQEMKDNGDLPKAGMEVLVDKRLRIVLLDADAGGFYVYKNEHGTYDFCTIEQIKPVETRTDKEKAVDDIFNEFTGSVSVNELLEMAYDKWVGNNEK